MCQISASVFDVNVSVTSCLARKCGAFGCERCYIFAALTWLTLVSCHATWPAAWRQGLQSIVATLHVEDALLLRMSGQGGVLVIHGSF